jgi:LPXTG-motif cell wall-anchored protein
VGVYEPEGEPVGCCADYVGEVVAETVAEVQTVKTFRHPDTGAATAPLVGVGMGLLFLGVVAVWSSRRRRRVLV